MKIILNLIIVISLIGLISCNSGKETSISDEKVNEGPPQIEFTALEHDFGKINEGEVVGWYFSYVNTGGSDLIITNVKTTCGCTVPQYSRKPLPPGGKEDLQVIFDSSGRMGKEIKNVSVESNAQNNIINLKLIFEVIN